MHPALQLREILNAILAQLQDERPSLRSAMLVNGAWADEACPFLWRDPPAQAMAWTPADRRQHYASLIRRLELAAYLPYAVGSALNGLQFPRLRELVLHSNNEPFLAFAGRCPLLRTLRISTRRQASGDELALLQTNAATLTSVSLGWPLEMTTLAHLAGLPRLETLLLSNTSQLRNAQVRALAAQERSPPHFPRLRDLGVQGPSSTVSALLQLVGNSAVEALRLWLQDWEGTEFSRIAFPAHLKTLSIGFQIARQLQGTHLSALGRLSQLRELRVSMQHMWDDGDAHCDMDDDDLARLVSGLGQLRKLELIMWLPLTVAALTSIGTHCPLLEYLHVTASFSLGELRIGGRPLFPNLHYLLLERLEPNRTVSDARRFKALAADIVSALQFHAPQLKSLKLNTLSHGVTDDLDNVVVHLWKQAPRRSGPKSRNGGRSTTWFSSVVATISRALVSICNLEAGE
jgi:hypothetical protein